MKVHYILLLFALTSLAVAQNVPSGGGDQNQTTGPLKLLNTQFERIILFSGIGCNTPSCQNWTPLAAPMKVLCPGAAGFECTFAVHVDGVFSAVLGSNGYLVLSRQFQNANDYFIWASSGGSGSLAGGQPGYNNGTPASWTWFYDVTNSKRNQLHPVEVDLLCIDDGSGLCGVDNDFRALGSVGTVSTVLRVDVFAKWSAAAGRAAF
jgi:hypothetical protein